MNYDSSPVSIKKRTQRSTQQAKSSIASRENTSKHDALQSNSGENNNPATNAVETPVRKNGQVCDSPQFLDFAESPEFRVGWDDGFDTAKSACDKIKIDDTVTSSRKKSKKQVYVRTRRTQRILSNNCQPETVNVNDHPDCDEFLQWAESLLSATDPAKTETNVESPINSNSARLNPPLSTNNVPQSPKITDMKTPKRAVNSSTPSSENTKQKSIYRSTRKRSCTSDANRNSLLTKLEESPLVKHLNEEARKKVRSPANVSTNINQVTSKDEYSDYFNDSINELMIQCSQAVESKLNKENSDLNLLDDSSNDLILQCTQQVEEKLLRQNVVNRNKPIKSPLTGQTDPIDQEKQNDSNLQHRRSSSKSTSTKKPFIPKQATNLHKLDSPINFPFEEKETNNFISSISKQFMSKEFNQNLWSSPDSRRDAGSSSRSGTKHFLSPTPKAEATSRKKFCHNNNIVAPNVDENAFTSNSNQDLNSILNEDEDVLSKLDMDEVLSQAPSLHSFPKPNAPITSKPKLVPETKTDSSRRQDPENLQKSVRNQNISFNGFTLDHVKESNVGSKPVCPQIQKNTPFIPMPDVIPKYTQEQIQLKKIEAKRRQALKLRKQKSFELK